MLEVSPESIASSKEEVDKWTTPAVKGMLNIHSIVPAGDEDDIPLTSLMTTHTKDEDHVPLTELMKTACSNADSQRAAGASDDDDVPIAQLFSKKKSA